MYLRYLSGVAPLGFYVTLEDFRVTTITHLQKLTAKELGQMAKKRGVIGWYTMNKAELINHIISKSTNSSLASAGVGESKVLSANYCKPPKKTENSSDLQNQKSTNGSNKSTDNILSHAKNILSPKEKADKSCSIKRSTSSAALNGAALNGDKESTQSKISRLHASRTAGSSLSSVSKNSANANLSGSMTPQPGTPGTLGLPPLSAIKPIPRRANLVDLNSAASQRSTRDREFAGTMKEEQDRLVIMVRDAYWLHIHWNIRQRTRERIRASMNREWHSARPILRLYEVTTNNGLQSRKFIRNICIKPKSGNWFVDINGTPTSYQVEIGYFSEQGKFYSILTSNIVTTPEATTARGFGVNNFAETTEAAETPVTIAGIRVQRESRLHEIQDDLVRRLQNSGSATSSGTPLTGNSFEFPFSIDAKILLHGRTLPGAHITVRGYPVIVDEDGEFLMRMELPDKRQVIPIVASSGDGTQQRTIVLSLERNTRILEPVFCDMDEM